MPIINQNTHPISLPNFRNLGVMLRILLLANAMAFAVALAKAPSFLASGRELTEIAALLQPILLVSLLTLYVVSPWLYRLPYALGFVVVIVIELAIMTLLYSFEQRLLHDMPGDLLRYWVFCALATSVLLAYFNLRSRALSPALNEARVQALQSRIRPHFLFNTITAVLSLIRTDPRRAETALEDMADLFRVLMADNRELSTLQDEVTLCQQYLSIEQLRLGERLQIEWHIDKLPGDALIPPLVLQPLLENAVYHGIEPCSEPGVIYVNIYRKGNEVHAVLRNPYQYEGGHHGGNKMAVGNIRERLSLHFDAEASLQTRVSNNTYQVHITLPYMTTKTR